MDRPETERRLERIERLLQAASEETKRLRLTLGTSLDTSDRWARMMLGVLGDLDHRGGEVSRRAFLEMRRKPCLQPPRDGQLLPGTCQARSAGKIRLTQVGQERLELLQKRHATDSPNDADRSL